MRTRLRSVSVACALAVLVACGPALPPEAGESEAYLRVVRIGAEAQSMYEAGRWGDAAKLYRDQADAAAADPNLAGWRDQALYNLACVLARDGRTTDAADAFALSVADGLRPALGPTTGGAWALAAPAVTLPHLLADPDLDAIRGEAAYREAIRGYVLAGTPVVEAVGGDGARRPVVIALVRPGPRIVAEGDVPPPVAPSAAPWVAAAGDRPVVVVALAPPVRPHPRAEVSASVTREGRTLFAPPLRSWLLPDGDDRWVVEKVRETLDGLASDPRADLDRVWLAAPEDDPEAGVAAWAAALAMPERIAGLAVPAGAYRRVPYADALASAPSKRTASPPWRVVLAGSDMAAEAALADARIPVTKAAPGGFVATTLDAALR